MNITEVLPHGSHSLSWQRHFPLQAESTHFEDVPELLGGECRHRASRQILHPVLVLSTRLRMGVLAAAVPVSLSKLCFANDLECIPSIVRMCEVPVEESSSTQARRKIIVDTDESRVNDEACAALASEPDLYQRGGQLVTVVEHLEESTSEARIRPLTQILLRECLTRCTQFVQRRETKDGDVVERKVHPKTWCVAAVHDRGHWPVPYLKAIVTHPVFLQDGSLLSKPG